MTRKTPGRVLAKRAMAAAAKKPSSAAQERKIRTLIAEIDGYRQNASVLRAQRSDALGAQTDAEGEVRFLRAIISHLVDS